MNSLQLITFKILSNEYKSNTSSYFIILISYYFHNHLSKLLFQSSEFCSNYDSISDQNIIEKSERIKKAVLVTGGAGFIGSHVAQECIDLDMRVVILDDLSGGFRQNLPKDAIFIHGDLKNATLLNEIFELYQFSYVYHLGAYAAEGLSHFIRSYNYRNNLVGSIELLNMSIKYNIDCFIFTSSIAVYGAGQTPMTESTIPNPEDPYGISKYAFELDLKAAHEMFGLDYIIYRPHNVNGPGQNIFDKYRNVVGIFMLQILQNKSLTIFGDGYQTRCFIYIRCSTHYIKITLINRSYST